MLMNRVFSSAYLYNDSHRSSSFTPLYLENALLLGGTRGVGFGTAQALAAAGAHVTIVGRSKSSGSRAVHQIREYYSARVDFLQGDVGTVCSALNIVKRLESRNKRYDFAVVSAATFPDWSRPLQNDDGLDKSFAIAVVGRFLMYRNMHRFMNDNARILNVMASGEKLPANVFDQDVASGKRNVTSLLDAMMNFGVGNEIMMDSLFRYDENYANGKQYTMVSTHPGMLKTDLHRGQGVIFDIIETILVGLIGRSEEETGIRQSSILVSDKLHQFGLTFVDLFGYGRIRDPKSKEFVIEKNREWLWSFLIDLEKNTHCK